MRAQINTDIANRGKTQGTCAMVATAYADMHRDFIISSFYLPYEVLKDGRYKIEPIRTVTGGQFAVLLQLADTSKGSVVIHTEGATLRLLTASRKVGISQRLDTLTATTHLVCKIWFGDKK